MHRLVRQASNIPIIKSIVRPRTDACVTASHPFVGGNDNQPTTVTMKSSDNASRRPLASLPSNPSDGNKSSESIGKPIPPPKPVPSPRTKLIRARTGSGSSSQGSATSSPLKQPYLLQKSNSTLSQPKIPHVASLSDTHRRARSYSSSAVPDPNLRARSYSSSAVAVNNSNPETLASLLSTLDMRRHKYGDAHPKVGSAWNRIGKFFFRACQYSRAGDAFKQAVACFPVGEPDLALCFSNLGAVYWASGQPDKAIQFLEKALEIYELHEITEGRDPDDSLEVASILYQMGLCNTLRKQYGEAMICLKKCQKIQASLLPPRDIQVGRTLDAIGKVHFFKEEYSTALHCHEEARRIKSASGDNEIAIVTSLLNIASVHHATKNWTAALKNYTKVMHLQKSELVRCRNQKGQPLLVRAAQELGETMQLMGDLNRHMDQEEQALRYFKEAALLYEEAGLGEEDPRMVALK